MKLSLLWRKPSDPQEEADREAIRKRLEAAQLRHAQSLARAERVLAEFHRVGRYVSRGEPL